MLKLVSGNHITLTNKRFLYLGNTDSDWWGVLDSKSTPFPCLHTDYVLYGLSYIVSCWRQSFCRFRTAKTPKTKDSVNFVYFSYSYVNRLQILYERVITVERFHLKVFLRSLSIHMLTLSCLFLISALSTKRFLLFSVSFIFFGGEAQIISLSHARYIA